MRHAPGFTLLELVCTLGILLLLGAIAAPRISSALPAASLEQAVRTLAAEARLARVRAVSRNARVRIVANLERGTHAVEREAEGRFVDERPERPLPGGVRFDAAGSTRVSGGRVSITFLPRGTTADNATIALAAGGRSRRVIVNNSGRVRIE